VTIVLDTNIVSELLRPAPEPKVEVWLAAQDGAQVYVTTITEAELRYGVAILAGGKRRDMLTEAIDAMLREDFRGRILPFDSAAAEAYAAIGCARQAAIATRNARDFEGCGIAVIDPWRDR
jgi:hypothetical protein